MLNNFLWSAALLHYRQLPYFFLADIYDKS